MNIRNLTDSLPAQGARSKPKGPVDTSVASGAATAGAVEGADKVALSSTSRELQRAENGDLPVDAQKVAALRKAIAEGSYRVDSKALADKLIAHNADLLQAGSQSNN